MNATKNARQSFLICMLVCTLMCAPARASDTVDVLVAVAPGVNGDPATFSDILGSFTEFVHDNSGIGISNPNQQKIYRFRPYLIPPLYPFGSSGTSVQAHDWLLSLYDPTQPVDPSLKAARETTSLTIPLGVPAYDLVVLIVPKMLHPTIPNREDCGRASNLYGFPFGFDPIDEDAAENRFALVISDTLACRLKRQQVIVHELGHILGGNHQIDTPSWTHPTSDDSVTWPRLDNHPVAYFNTSNEPIHMSAMAGSILLPGRPQYSSDDPNAILISTNLPAGNPSADMVSIINDYWHHVAAYRPIPEPDECGMSASFQFCVGDNSSYAFTATLPGYEVTSADYDISFWGGSWEDVYEGALICPSASGLGEAVVRAILQTASGQSECQQFISFSNCGDHNPW